MPESVYIDDEIQSMLNRIMAIKPFNSYSEAIKEIVKEYYSEVFSIEKDK